MTGHALNMLDRLIRQKPTRENRVTELLKDPTAESPEGWFMCVPACFNDALDIKQTQRVQGKKKSIVWTQGSSFAFKAGDTLYDTADAYKVWSEALKSIALCVQVKTASSAGASKRGTRRFPGLVTFSILTPDERRTKITERGEHTMSQDEFVRFLIAGSPDDLKQKPRKPQRHD